MNCCLAAWIALALYFWYEESPLKLTCCVTLYQVRLRYMECDDSWNFHRFWELSALRPFAYLDHQNKPVSKLYVFGYQQLERWQTGSGVEQENVTESHRCYLARDEEKTKKRLFNCIVIKTWPLPTSHVKPIVKWFSHLADCTALRLQIH
jgi:hypothetical protein